MHRLKPALHCSIALSSVVALLSLGWVLAGGYVNEELWDPQSSTGKSGVDTPREYFIPPPPMYEKTDWEEFDDYHKTYYSPYAQLQIPRPVKIGEVTLKEGYYLVKLSVVPVVRPVPAPVAQIPPDNTNPKQASDTGFVAEESGPPAQTASTPPPKRDDLAPARREQRHIRIWHKSPADGRSSKKAPYRKHKNLPPVDPDTPQEQRTHRLSLMIKLSGNVEVSVPVEASEAGKERIKKGSVARFVIEPGDPLRPEVVYLKYCVRKTCYRTVPLEPGLVQ